MGVHDNTYNILQKMPFRISYLTINNDVKLTIIGITVAIVAIITIIIVSASNIMKFKELFDFWNITRKNEDKAGDIIAYYSSVKSNVKGMNNTMFAACILDVNEEFKKVIAIFFIDLMIDGKLIVKNDSISFVISKLNKYQKGIIRELFDIDNLYGFIINYKKLRARCLTVSYPNIENIKKIIMDAISDSGYVVNPTDAWYLSRWFEKKWKETPLCTEDILLKHLHYEMANLRYVYSIIYQKA